MFLRIVVSIVVVVALFMLSTGCSFEAQPLFQADIYIDAKEKNKVVESFKTSLNKLVFKEQKQRFLKFRDVEVSPAFVVHQNGNDHYRIKYVDANESNLLEIKFDGAAKTMVWENSNYTVYIIPLWTIFGLLWIELRAGSSYYIENQVDFYRKKVIV